LIHSTTGDSKRRNPCPSVSIHKLPSGGDYQIVYVKDGDKQKRFVYDWKNDKLYYTTDHYNSWRLVDNPWRLGGPKFPPPM